MNVFPLRAYILNLLYDNYDNNLDVKIILNIALQVQKNRTT